MTMNHFPWCDESTIHDLQSPGIWWHSREIGTITVVSNDIATALHANSPDTPPPTAVPGLELALLQHDGQPGPRVGLNIQGRGESIEIDADGIRQARDLFTHVADLLDIPTE